MALNESKGNMYDFVTHTFNMIKGACFHDCAYCYMKRYGTQQPVRFDTKEEYTDLGTGNFIPEQVNVGADSGGYKMPEPGKDKVFELICRLRDFTKVNIKPNLKRLTG